MAVKDTEKKIKVDAETHEHLKSIGFKKGKSGNPKGRPPTAPELKMKAAYLAPEMIDILYDLAINSPNDMARLQAATRILGYNVSQAPQEQQINMNVNHGFGDFLARTNARPNVIEAQVTDVKTIETK